MTKYSDYIKFGDKVCYKGYKVMIDEIIDIFFADYPTAEELDRNPDLYLAHIIYENGKAELLPITKLLPIRHVTDLSESELIKLRKQIYVGSCFYGDYENSLGVEKKELSDVCDSYLEALESECQYEWLTTDTPSNFAEYCADYYCHSEKCSKFASKKIC